MENYLKTNNKTRNILMLGLSYVKREMKKEFEDPDIKLDYKLIGVLMIFMFLVVILKLIF